jgi:hypothetical protein
MKHVTTKNVQTPALELVVLEQNVKSLITTRFVVAHLNIQEIPSLDVILLQSNLNMILLLTHVNLHRVDPTLNVEIQMAVLLAPAYPNLLDHHLIVDQNVLRILNALLTKLVFDKNVKILALTFVEKMQNVM